MWHGEPSLLVHGIVGAGGEPNLGKGREETDTIQRVRQIYEKQFQKKAKYP